METHNENHDEKNPSKKKKKGILASIWESMNKTGGCCGSGKSCCLGLIKDKNKRDEQQDGSGKI